MLIFRTALHVPANGEVLGSHAGSQAILKPAVPTDGFFQNDFILYSVVVIFFQKCHYKLNQNRFQVFLFKIPNCLEINGLWVKLKQKILKETGP